MYDSMVLKAILNKDTNDNNSTYKPHNIIPIITREPISVRTGVHVSIVALSVA